MAGMRKLKGKWYIRVYLGNGKEKLLPTKTGDKKQAEVYRRQIENREFLVRSRLAEKVSYTSDRLSEVIGAYMKDCRARLRRSTCDSYQLALDNLMACWGDIQIDRITPEHLSSFRQYLSARLNPTATNIRLRSVRAFLNWMVTNGKLERLPAKIVLLKTDEALPKFFAPDELNRIFSKVKDAKMKATLRVLAGTGLRRSELYRCSLENGYLHLRQTKGRKDRLVALPPDLIPDFLLATDNPYQPNTVTHAFARAIRNAGVEPKGRSLHSLRHTFALQEYYRTGDIYYVKGLLGHSAVSVTERYLQFPQEYLERVFGRHVIRRTTAEYISELTYRKPPFNA